MRPSRECLRSAHEFLRDGPLGPPPNRSPKRRHSKSAKQRSCSESKRRGVWLSCSWCSGTPAPYWACRNILARPLRRSVPLRSRRRGFLLRHQRLHHPAHPLRGDRPAGRIGRLCPQTFLAHFSRFLAGDGAAFPDSGVQSVARPHDGADEPVAGSRSQPSADPRGGLVAAGPDSVYALFATLFFGRSSGIAVLGAWGMLCTVNFATGMLDRFPASFLFGSFNLEFFFGMSVAWLLRRWRPTLSWTCVVLGLPSFFAAGMHEAWGPPQPTGLARPPSCLCRRGRNDPVRIGRRRDHRAAAAPAPMVDRTRRRLLLDIPDAPPHHHSLAARRVRARGIHRRANPPSSSPPSSISPSSPSCWRQRWPAGAFCRLLEQPLLAWCRRRPRPVALGGKPA